MDSFDYALAGAIGVWVFVIIAIAILLVVASCKIFVKMGRKWWEAIIPFYNAYVMAEMIFGNGLWFLCSFASFIPVVGYIVILLYTIISCLRLSNSFKKGTGFGIGLIFLSPIFMLILAFGDAEYEPLAPFEISHPFDFNPAGYTDATYTDVNTSASSTEASSEKVFCTNCGTELQEGQDFCPNCGTKRA